MPLGVGGADVEFIAGAVVKSCLVEGAGFLDEAERLGGEGELLGGATEIEVGGCHLGDECDVGGAAGFSGCQVLFESLTVEAADAPEQVHFVGGGPDVGGPLVPGDAAGAGAVETGRGDFPWKEGGT